MVEVTLRQGMLRGVRQDGYVVFKGIPYAKAPVGELRWRAPQEAEPWEGILEADTFGARCWQTNHPKDSFWAKEFYPDEKALPVCNEDCLNLNIWMPEHIEGAPLPVAVWIHGGAFMHGFNCEMEFDGAGFARRGVILVSINYRLGIFGFLSHPWLAEEAGHCGNYGLLDQIAALRWVRENIAAFGGDPERITIMGQSAGSMSVQSLLSSELTRSMVHGAIMQSGAGYKGGFCRDCSVEQAQIEGQRWSSAMGFTSLEDMRKMPAEELLVNTRQYIEETGRWFLGPVIDGYVLKQGYDASIEQGIVPEIPCMIGCNSQDMKSSEDVDLTVGSRNWSLAMKRPSYVYYFTQQLLGDDAGAFHSAELWYMFETLQRSWRPKTQGDYLLAKQMGDFWANFVRTGNPNPEGSAVWRPCTEEDPYVQVLHCEMSGTGV